MTFSTTFTRRSLLIGTTAALPLLATKPTRRPKLRIGVPDWNLALSAKVEAVALAASLGFEGVEISLGRKIVDNKLPLDNAELQERYLAAFQEHKIAPAGTCLDILHTNYLNTDPLAKKWIADAIPITRKLGAKVILMPSFGKGEIKTQQMDYVGDVLRELGAEAEKNGLTLGLENTNSAEENVRIMERSRSAAVKVYYDVGNSTASGYDIMKEIEWLGVSRICQLHFKDGGHYLGEGRIDFKSLIALIVRLGYGGFANLETDSPAHDIPADMRRNLAFVRGLLGRG